MKYIVGILLVISIFFLYRMGVRASCAREVKDKLNGWDIEASADAWQGWYDLSYGVCLNEKGVR